MSGRVFSQWVLPLGLGFALSYLMAGVISLVLKGSWAGEYGTIGILIDVAVGFSLAKLYGWRRKGR